MRYSYRELSEKCGVSPAQLLRMESGEFEYSVAKLFNVCLSLGLPLGSVIEPATVSHLRPAVQDFDKEVQAILMAKGEKHFAARLARALQYVWNCCNAATLMLTASEPRHAATFLDFPFPDVMGEPYHHFASSVDYFSNVERINTLRSLQQSPYRKLKSLGLIDAKQITDYLATTEDWKVEMPIRDFIAHTVLLEEVLTDPERSKKRERNKRVQKFLDDARDKSAAG